MNVRCPECSKVYRVDPQRVPAGGVRTRCTECGALFALGAGGVEVVAQPAAAQDPPVQERAAGPAPGPSPSVGAPAPPSATPSPAAVFGPQDPKTRARRLARALVSDIVVYHPDRRERSLKGGTLRREFREEILKSWDEYVEQVGEEMAKKTPFFRDALNEILAKGQKVF